MAKKRSIPRRILKWTGITIVTLIVLIVIAVLVIPHVVNTGPVKREIENVASRNTGRAVTITGPISLTLFPWVGFDAKDVSMANASGFGTQPFMHVNELEVHVKLIPLIFHNVQVSGITLDQPTLTLARKADGTSNWQDLTANKNKETNKQAPGERRGAITKLFIGRVTVNGATLDYTDAHTGKHYTVRNGELDASDIVPGKPFPLSLQFDVASMRPHFKARAKLDTQAVVNASSSIVTLSDGSFISEITQAGLGTESLPVNAQWKSISLDQTAGTAILSGLALKVANLNAELDAKASGLNQTPTFSGHLEVPDFAPRPFFTALGDTIPTTFTGFKQASLTTDLDAGTQSAKLTNLKLELDDTTLTGTARIINFDTHALRFNLAADRVDLDDYLPASAKQSAPVVAESHGKNFTETRLPGDLLKKLDLSGKLAIGQLTGFGLLAQNLAVTLKAANGTLSADPIAATLYGGSYSGKLSATAAGNGIRLTIAQKLMQVDTGKLITALSGSARLTGAGDVSIQLTGQGDTVAELQDNLKGQTTFAIKRGTLEGVNLWQSLEQAYVLVKERKKIPIAGPDRTEFTDLEGTGNIANGIMKSDALSADLPSLALTGHGNMNFKDGSLDYDLLGKVHDAPKTANADLSGLDGLAVPIHVSGEFSHLSVKPDILAIIEAKAKSALQKKLDLQKQSTQDKLKQKLQDLLGGDNGGGG
ncbi:MAG: AsmA family protein [Gammaproteobacteria bacterium]